MKSFIICTISQTDLLLMRSNQWRWARNV